MTAPAAAVASNLCRLRICWAMKMAIMMIDTRPMIEEPTMAASTAGEIDLTLLAPLALQ